MTWLCRRDIETSSIGAKCAALGSSCIDNVKASCGIPVYVFYLVHAKESCLCHGAVCRCQHIIDGLPAHYDEDPGTRR